MSERAPRTDLGKRFDTPAAADPRLRAEPANLSYRADGATGGIDLARAGLVVLPLPRHSESFSSLLLEALDRARAGGRRRVSLSSAVVELELEVPDSWPQAGELPSMVFGGGVGAQSTSSARTGLARHPWLNKALARLTPEQLDDLRQFPGKRRALAALQRQRESELTRQDDLIRSRARAARWCLLGTLFALAGLAAGVAQQIPIAQFVAAAVFFVFAATMAYERLSRAGMLDRRERLEARVEQAARRASAADAHVRELSAELGYDDPWEASARAQELTVERRAAPTEDLSKLVPIARSLAEQGGVDPESIDWPRSHDWRWPAPGPTGWPPEVSGGAHLSQGDLFLCSARLIERVERLLPRPWPIVLWEPWSEVAPRERAQLMMALSRFAASRCVLAVVESAE